MAKGEPHGTALQLLPAHRLVEPYLDLPSPLGLEKLLRRPRIAAAAAAVLCRGCGGYGGRHSFCRSMAWWWGAPGGGRYPSPW